MTHSPVTPASTVVSVRLEAPLLRQLHLLADRRAMTVSDAARHLMTLGIDQLQAAA